MKALLHAPICLALLLIVLAAGSHRPEAVRADSSESRTAVSETGDVSEEEPVHGTVVLSTAMQQAIGVKTAVVEIKSVTNSIRLLGRVAADDTRIYRINASVDGWITKVNANSVGSLVKKGEVLATFTNPQFIDTEQSYLFAIDTVQRLGLHKRQELGRKEAPTAAAFDPFVLQRQMDALRGMGVGDAQLEEIGRTRKMTLDIRITAPVEGFVTAKKVSPQERFLKGTELYRIEDLRRIWILADAYEREADYFHPGIKARITAPYHQKTCEATVTEILPVFDGGARTLKVRLEADNSGYLLRSDMFVDIELPVTYPPAMMVPADAVLDSGLRKTVFVDRGNGCFEPREVETGRWAGRQVEIADGLDAGERIVVSGNFMLDSESRMELAAWGVPVGFSRDPACDVEVSERKAAKEGRSLRYKGKTYFFANDACKEIFEKNPESYTSGQ